MILIDEQVFSPELIYFKKIDFITIIKESAIFQYSTVTLPQVDTRDTDVIRVTFFE